MLHGDDLRAINTDDLFGVDQRERYDGSTEGRNKEAVIGAIVDGGGIVVRGSLFWRLH